LSQQLRDELEQAMQRVPSYRAHPLSDRVFSLCAPKPVRSRPCSQDPLDQGLRDATQPEVAGHRCLLAHLSRLQAGDLLAALVKDV
jgi:hypothetical protein